MPKKFWTAQRLEAVANDLRHGMTLTEAANWYGRSKGALCTALMKAGLRAAPLPEEDRFWLKVAKGPGCWLWLGGLKDNNFGYGIFRFRGRATASHRVSYIIAHGSIPEGMWVLHRCDNPACVRPDHLFLGDNAANIRDMDSKGRRPTKVSWAEVEAIRASKEPSPVLAARYGIRDGSVRNIRSGRKRKINYTRGADVRAQTMTDSRSLAAPHDQPKEEQ